MKHYSVVLASFKRNGGEGEFTKIITLENSNNFKEQLSLIEKDERPLICYRKDASHWLLLTEKRVLQQDGDSRIVLLGSEIVDVSLALEEQRKAKQISAKLFTMLEVETVSGEKYILKVESGNAFTATLYAISLISTGKNEK